jgi:hypothetical protein
MILHGYITNLNLVAANRFKMLVSIGLSKAAKFLLTPVVFANGEIRKAMRSTFALLSSAIVAPLTGL